VRLRRGTVLVRGGNFNTDWSVHSTVYCIWKPANVCSEYRIHSNGTASIRIFYKINRHDFRLTLWYNQLLSHGKHKFSQLKRTKGLVSLNNTTCLPNTGWHKKLELLKNPTKIEEIKKIIDRNWTIITCLLRSDDPWLIKWRGCL